MNCIRCADKIALVADLQENMNKMLLNLTNVLQKFKRVNKDINDRKLNDINY